MDFLEDCVIFKLELKNGASDYIKSELFALEWVCPGDNQTAPFKSPDTFLFHVEKNQCLIFRVRSISRLVSASEPSISLEPSTS